MNRAERRRQAKTQRSQAPNLTQVQALLERGQSAEARRLLARLLKQRPEDAAALQLSGLLALQEGDAPRAVGELRKAERLSPGDPGLNTNLAIALGEAGEPEAALETLDGLLSGTPDYAPALFNKARLLRGRGETEAALVALGSALTAQPGYSKARRERARLLQALGRYAEAASDYAQAGAEDAETLLDWGQCLQESGDFEGALALYRQVLAADGGAYPAVVKTLTTASKGVLCLHPSQLRRLLGGKADYG